MKILFAGGGTGGHLFSGVAVAEALSEEDKNEVLFVGTPYGLESQLIPKLNFRLALIPVKPLKGKGFSDRLKSLFQLPYSFLKSIQLLRKEKPDVVIGIGGYASGPVTLTARFMGITTAIVEQNSYPGFTNRVLGKFVDAIFIAFEKARRFFPPSRTFLTGNPVRRGFLGGVASPDSPNRSGFTVLVLGGSQGARSINQAMVEAASRWSPEKRPAILHQTGPADFESVKASYEKAGVPAQVFDFIQDVKKYYAQADLVVSRAGAGTITELENMGKASILIPYPYAADDHQRTNAEELVEAGAARLLLNQALTGESLFGEVEALRKDPEALNRMGKTARDLARPQAAADILKICEKLHLGD